MKTNKTFSLDGTLDGQSQTIDDSSEDIVSEIKPLIKRRNENASVTKCIIISAVFMIINVVILCVIGCAIFLIFVYLNNKGT